MKIVTAFFRLVRWPNLLIIFFTQGLICLCLWPYEQESGNPLGVFGWLLLSATTIFIAAGGYLLNDIKDVAIDKINKPDRVIISKVISANSAYWIYFALNITALALAIYLSLRVGNPLLWLTQLICVVILALYAFRWKKAFLIGNLSVSFLTAFTPFILLIYEPDILSYYSKPALFIDGKWLNPVWFVSFYAWFAFIITLVREIVKDMEDVKGDHEANAQTLPIKLGWQTAGRTMKIIYLISIGSLILISFNIMKEAWLLIGIWWLVIALGMIIWISRAGVGPKDPVDCGKWSLWLKLVMVFGLIPLPLFFVITDYLS